MKLATLRTSDGTRAARLIDKATLVELDAPDVGALLAKPDWPAVAADTTGALHPFAGASLAPVVPHPGKVVCVGLNYRNHILEMGRQLPEHPTLFAKFAEALIGARDDVMLPRDSGAVDWEAELALVIGAPVRDADEAAAAAAIAGFSVLNDVTMRDWQYRTPQWLQGKTWEDSTPFGPFVVTPEELPGGVRPRLSMRCSVDARVVQETTTADLVFDPVALVRYVSRIVTLKPADVIATGTPGGVGHARVPKEYLTDGAVLVTEIEGLGRLENVARCRPKVRL